MNPDAVFNRYDIRGDHPDEIDGGFAERLGRALGTWTVRNGRGQVVVGRDTRDASAAVQPAFIAGVRATGANVVDIGAGTTDRVAVAAAHYGGTGVMVTASHHAWDRTGFKLLYEAGNGFTNDDLDAVEELFRDRSFESGEGTLLRAQHEVDEIYVEELGDAVRDLVDGDIDADVIVDTAGGAGRTAAAAFEEVGASVTEHRRSDLPAPEPTEESRADLQELLAEEGGDAAVGYDPDGDRVYLVHPELGWVDGDRMLYALAHITGADRIVASVDASPMLEELDAAIEYTRVGDVFVAERGREVEADLLGEPNGHYAVPAFSWYNSGILASLLLVAAADRLPGLLEPVAGYRSARRSAVYDTVEQRDAAFGEVKKRVAQEYDIVSRIDGVKFAADGITGLVRPSGTSPKLRAVVHTSPAEEADPASIADRLL
ncbi:MAG: hypothetical protein SVU88_02700 [Candidatus Nanohaloarchaea archaeon]|nr:hypothetical protein [Candidatus Nanohaloarchaea archaeon]